MQRRTSAPEADGQVVFFWLPGHAERNLCESSRERFSLSPPPDHHNYCQAGSASKERRRGLQFLDGLIILSRDSSLLPQHRDGDRRPAPQAHASEVCVDFVQHYTAASLEIREAMRAAV
jgi:hypothetical protein